ncbi:hypothetical protein L1887_03136 [Cichorium endivia]|nr:hypothetical protein L1887_03136 [Cichorium endivia]
MSTNSLSGMGLKFEKETIPHFLCLFNHLISLSLTCFTFLEEEPKNPKSFVLPIPKYDEESIPLKNANDEDPKLKIPRKKTIEVVEHHIALERSTHKLNESSCSSPSTSFSYWGTLPFRLLTAQYGAYITYGEKIIDHKLLKYAIGSIDIVEKGTENVVFRTCVQERNQVVFQMGTSDAVRDLKVAQLVCKDVAAIDVNMGCPKAFSVTCGMGAALMYTKQILTMLKRKLCIPVTCKIRLLNSTQDTIELSKRIEKTGVSAVAVHVRRVADRPRDPANWSAIAHVMDTLSIPVIANGDVFEYEDFHNIRAVTGRQAVI